MRLLLAVAMLLPALAFGQGVARTVLPFPEQRYTSSPAAALAGSLVVYGQKMPGRAFLVTGATMQVGVASGGGAGNTIITMSDGTNSCTLAWACSSTQTTGLKIGTVANGAGTGCAFPAAAAIVWTVTTGSCTTTQPTPRNIDVVGRWL